MAFIEMDFASGGGGTPSTIDDVKFGSESGFYAENVPVTIGNTYMLAVHKTGSGTIPDPTGCEILSKTEKISGYSTYIANFYIVKATSTTISMPGFYMVKNDIFLE